MFYHLNYEPLYFYVNILYKTEYVDAVKGWVIVFFRWIDFFDCKYDK